MNSIVKTAFVNLGGPLLRLMRIRTDKIATTVFSAGLALVGLAALLLIVAIFAGDGVQMPFYTILAGVSTALALCLLVEVALLIWQLIVMSLTHSRRLKPALLNIGIKSALAVVLLHVLAVTRLVWVQPVEYAFFQAPVVSPNFFVGGKLFPLSPVQGVATGLLFFGGIALAWVSTTVLPVVARSRDKRPKGHSG